MHHRETRLAVFTVALLLAYAPIEIWYSLPELWDPFFLVDLIGMVLLILGVTLGRHRSSLGFGMLTAGYAWTGANFWRGMIGRVMEVTGGGTLEYGWAELCFNGGVLLAAIAGLAWSLASSASESTTALQRP